MDPGEGEESRNANKGGSNNGGGGDRTRMPRQSMFQRDARPRAPNATSIVRLRATRFLLPLLPSLLPQPISHSCPPLLTSYSVTNTILLPPWPHPTRPFFRPPSHFDYWLNSSTLSGCRPQWTLGSSPPPLFLMWLAVTIPVGTRRPPFDLSSLHPVSLRLRTAHLFSITRLPAISRARSVGVRTLKM